MATKTKKPTQASKRYAIISFINPKNAGAMTVSNYKAKDGSTVYLQDANGNQVERTIRPPKMRLDLDVTDDRLFYEFMLNHIYVKGATPVLKITNRNEEAKNENSKFEEIGKINAMIVSMDEDALMDYGLILGYDIDQGDEELVKNSIYKHVAANPADALKSLQDPDYKLRVLVHRAKKEKEFVEENGVWKYGQIVIGKDLDQVLLWLKQNPVVHESLKNRFHQVAA